MSASFQAHIHQHLGYAPEFIVAGRIVRFATSDRKGDRSGWCKLFADELGGVYGDWRSREGGSWFGDQHQPNDPRQRARRRQQIVLACAAEQRQRESDWHKAAGKNAGMWREAQQVKSGDPVDRYLKSRGIGLNAYPAALRYHPGLDYWADGATKVGRFPAMLAAVLTPAGDLLSIHRTYLTEEGRKAGVDIVRKLSPPAGRMDGASIMLAAPKRIDGIVWLGVAEGIETALAASALFGVPTVAAVSAGGLEKFECPQGVQSLVIFADNDHSGTGEAAARHLAAHTADQGIVTRISMPPAVGTDWADVCLGENGATA